MTISQIMGRGFACTGYPRSEQMAESPHRVLAAFIRGCSPDPATRTVATTALLLTLWQIAGRRMSRQVPSLVLLNASEAERDPVDAFVAGLLPQAGSAACTDKEEDHAGDPRPGRSLRTMGHLVQSAGRLGKSSVDQRLRREHEALFLKTQTEAYGCGRSRPYAGAWQDGIGLLTDGEGEAILRLEEPADRVAFRRDVLEAPGKLRDPEGPGPGLALVRKHVAVSGSLTRDLWNGKLAAGTVELGLPFFFLPHLAHKRLVTANQPALDFLTLRLPEAFASPVEEPAALPSFEWSQACGASLRGRLRELPAAYDYAVQRAVRELAPVCARIAAWTSRGSEAKREEVDALVLDLHALALHGMAIGVAALAWHGLGFDPGCPRSKMEKVLRDLRGKGRLDKSAVRGCARLDKGQRDILLERLAAEDLVRVDGRMVEATGFAKFVAALHARREFTGVIDDRATVAAGGRGTGPKRRRRRSGCGGE